MRKTKIICTLGPATDEPGVLEELVKNGMNVARMNFSHGTYEEHKRRIDEVKKIREKLGVPIAIMLDTKGPEIRIGTFKEGKVNLESGQEFVLTTENTEGDETKVTVRYANLPHYLKIGERVLFADGLIETEVVRKTDTEITLFVKNGGTLSNRKSINLPDGEIDMPYMNEYDMEDIRFGLKK